MLCASQLADLRVKIEALTGERRNRVIRAGSQRGEVLCRQRAGSGAKTLIGRSARRAA